MCYSSGLILLCASFLIISDGYAQTIGYQLEGKSKRVEIPFERYNNLVALPVTINDSITLKFILDTGVHYPILTEKAYAEAIGLNYDRKLLIHGPGQNDSIEAYVSDRISISLPGVRGENLNLLVLEKDYLKLSNNLGASIQGIIGYEIFNRFVVEIDFDSESVILHEPSRYRRKRYYKAVPLTIEKTKPYITATLTQFDGSKVDAKLMIDLGASHAILLNTEYDSRIRVPDQTMDSKIGVGLGGEIQGVMGRMKKVKIGKFTFDDVIASFPRKGDYGYGFRADERSGTIGGEILTRFNPVFDYSRGVLYLRRSKEYKKSFEFDLSGIELTSTGRDLRVIYVSNVRPGSPADEAGVRKGDVVTMVNGHSAFDTSLNVMNTLLRYKPDRKVRMKVIRYGTEMKFVFELKRLI